MAIKKDTTVSKFSKEQFLNAKNPIGNVDVLYVVLEDDKFYAKDEAIKLHDEFMEREVK